MSGADLRGPFPERRRAPRADVDRSAWFSVPSTWPVQLLDVGMGGVALSSPYGLEVGRTVAVRATLGGDAFSSELRVCWIRPRASAPVVRPQFDIGAAFLPLEEGSRQALQSFLKLSPTE